MKKPPAVATGLLLRFGSHDESFVGDLVEEYVAGRSRSWYWRQVVTAMVLTSGRHIAAHPWRAAAALGTGWATVLLIFFTLGDRTANALAGWVWHWDRQTAYATAVWWPFQIAAALVSYAGMALSAVVVVRLHPRYSGPMVLAYAASVLLVLTASAVILEALTQTYGRVAVPHGLFYLVSISLPYHWRSGLLLAPSIILGVGLLCSRPRLVVSS